MTVDALARQQRKAALRQQMLARRREHRPPPDWTGRIAAAGAPLLDHRSEGGVIAGYIPIQGEADPMPLMRLATDKGWRLALPRMESAGVMHFHRWQPGEVLVTGPYGIGEPEAAAPRVTPDLVLVPLVAFDAARHRLGYGGGYYDRALAALKREHLACSAVGVAYAWQRVDEVYAAPHDIALDGIIAL